VKRMKRPSSIMLEPIMVAFISVWLVMTFASIVDVIIPYGFYIMLVTNLLEGIILVTVLGLYKSIMKLLAFDVGRAVAPILPYVTLGGQELLWPASRNQVSPMVVTKGVFPSSTFEEEDMSGRRDTTPHSAYRREMIGPLAVKDSLHRHLQHLAAVSCMVEDIKNELMSIVAWPFSVLLLGQGLVTITTLYETLMGNGFVLYSSCCIYGFLSVY
ncbi:hypothetical protein Hamer_G016831, partial [Homarus americanus]